MATRRDARTPLRPAEPAVGFEVFTVDGLPVGTVSEIAGAFMRIDARLRPDFWLRLDDATNVEGGAITLAYPHEAVEQHKHPAPASTSDDYTPVGADPVLLDEEERQHQREQMEHELEAQRWRREQRAPETPAPVSDEWQYEQEAGAKVAGIVVAAALAVAGIAVLMLALKMLRNRR